MYINNYKTHAAKYGIHTELIGYVFGKLTVICTALENRANRREIALKEISYDNLATKPRELRDLKKLFAKHQFDYDEFFIKFIYNPKSMKFNAVAIHESIINKYILNDYPNKE